MKSKIEKIESVYDLYDGDRNVDANKLKDILNNIIEALNSQSQPEEKTVEERMKEVEIPYMETAKLEEWNENERRKRDKLAMDMLDNAYKLHYVKDTPEEWGELKEILDEYTIYADCFPTTPTNAVKARKNLENKIQQLLEDKEREVVQKVVNETRNMERLSIKQGISGEKAMKRLRNLIESLYEFNLLSNKKK